MIYIALGANLRSSAGAPEQTLQAALRLLADKRANPLSVSRLFRTPAWPDKSDPPFINAVAELRTALEPAELLAVLHEIETMFGRVRSKRNAPRTLDLDLLDYHGRVESGPPQLPHPRICARNFVLVPLAEVAPNWQHPVSGRPIGDIIAALPEDDRKSIAPLP